VAVSSSAVTVTTTATRLDSTESDDIAGHSVVAWVPSGSTIYIGGADVTAANGLPVSGPGYSPGFVLGPAESLYAITADGTASIRVAQVS
jgi:hypothetical protein